jgi:NTE family protein
MERSGVALALSGGFARGFAHLGVLEILEQEHIPVSAIAGTSVGGLLGAAYADGYSIRELCDLGRQVRLRDFIRFHRSSQITPRTDRISRFVQEWFHATRWIEELSIPTAILATDLETCAAHVFTHGPLEIAIRATCAFPGLFQPVEHQGRLLADGCIVAPVPTAVAARMNALCVVGVAAGIFAKNTPCADDACRQCDPATGPSRRLRDSLGTIQNKRRQKPSWSRHADLLLEPDVHEIGWDDFGSLDQAHAAGVEAMRHALPFLRELLESRSQMRRPEESSGMAQSERAS